MILGRVAGGGGEAQCLPSFFPGRERRNGGENRGGRGAKSERVKKFSVLPLPSLLRERGGFFELDQPTGKSLVE